MEKPVVRLFACGGCAANIAADIYQREEKKAKAGFANLSIAFVDTSSSNLSDKIENKDIYLLSNADGSGGYRRTHSKELSARVKEIVSKFSPCDLNIVLHSFSGGSGSVASPLLVKELLEKDYPVLVIGVTDTSTNRYAQNTLDTLKSYESISKLTNKPVVLSLFNNQGTQSHSDVNDSVSTLISDLTCLFSGDNHGLDSQDLKNWLRYDIVTDWEPTLSYMLNTFNEEKIEEIYGVAKSVATLVPPGGIADFAEIVDYQCVGEAPTEIVAGGKGTTVHFVITDGMINEVAKSLKEKIDENKERREARVKPNSLLSDKDNIDDSGLVL